jgi:DNA-binding response OmpR family regulator
VRLLLIEDDTRLLRLMEQELSREGHQVDVASDGEAGLDLALRGPYDVAIIDWMLPGRDGPSICRAIKSAKSDTALLMLTARSQVEDRVAGLDSGADDYLVKPFSFDELQARVRALGRRFSNGVQSPWELRVGSLVMDLRSHTARRDQAPLDLTKTEWTLLEYLMRHPDQVLSRQQILDYVWTYSREVQPNMVDVYISYLRSKLKDEGKKDPIGTVRGVGYRLESSDA